MYQLINYHEKFKIYYPSFDNEKSSNDNQPLNDEYFIDQTLMNVNENNNKKCCNDIIIRTDNNKFTIKKPGIKAFTIYVTIIGIISEISIIILFALLKFFLLLKIIIIIVNTLFLIFYILFLFLRNYYYIYLDLEPDSIIIRKKAVLSTKTSSYSINDLERAAIYNSYDDEYKTYEPHYLFYLELKSGEKVNFLIIKEYTQINNNLNGIKYFIDLINDHIQKYKR